VPSEPPVSVYDYLDYRAFLRDYYAAKKAASRAFSYRAFSKRAGVASPNYLKLVIEGQRSLSPKMAERFAQACGLDGDASRYFVHLVGFNQAKTTVERAQFYDKLTGFQRYRQAHKLELAHAAYYSDWYMPAIRELAASHEFREDSEWIADRLIVDGKSLTVDLKGGVKINASNVTAANIIAKNGVIHVIDTVLVPE
jgi:uncharacterized protein (TIGR02147 family)